MLFTNILRKIYAYYIYLFLIVVPAIKHIKSAL